MNQRCPSRLKMRRCRTAVIPRKRISGAAAPHRFSGESVPHRCHAARVSQDMLPSAATPRGYRKICYRPLPRHEGIARYVAAPLPRREGIARYVAAPLPRCNIFENTCRCHATAAVVTQISHKEAYFYKSEEYSMCFITIELRRSYGVTATAL